MADSFVQVAPDGGGKSIDSQAISNVAGSTVYRQTVVIGDPNNIGAMLNIDISGILQTASQWDRLNGYINYQTAQIKANEQQCGIGNGFVPLEIPNFLIGV